MKYILILFVALLIGCNSLTDSALTDTNFPVGAKILTVYNSQRPFILWEFNGSCYITTSRYGDLSGDMIIMNAKCPYIIDPIKIIQASN